MASVSGGDGESHGGDIESHDGDVEYWKKSAKESFLGSFKHPKLKGTVYDTAKNIPKNMRHKRMMNPQEYEHYMKKFRESKGFDVRGCTGSVCGGIVEISKGNRYRELAELFAKFSVEHHNYEEDTMLEFINLVRANVQCAAGAIYYLTLRALDKQDGKTKTFRAKVFRGFEDYELRSFEEAPAEETTPEGEGLDKETKRKKVKSKRRKVTSKSRSRAQRPFVTFVKELRHLPILEERSYSEVVSIASNIWASLSCEEKAEHSATRSSMFEEKVKKKVEELLGYYT